MRVHNLEHSMSRRGNYHDTAATETFFSSLKHARIQRRTEKMKEKTAQDVFD